MLGAGVSGFVFAAPDYQTAVKVHTTAESYKTEVRAYKVLNQFQVNSVLGLTVPRLRSRSDWRHLIRMDLVSPPFLLDFAGVRFTDPQFTDDVMNDVHAGIRAKFGRNADLAYAVQYELRKLGMYYLDLRPSNVNFEGLKGIDTSPLPSDDDEPY